MLSNLRVNFLKMFAFRCSASIATVLVIVSIVAASFKPNIKIASNQMAASENNLPAKVLFSPMLMEFSVIKNYYIKNDTSNGFGYFVFQPIQEDATKWKDRYILIAYAYKVDGTPMHDVSNPLKLKVNPNGITFRTFGRLHLGNLILSRTKLNELYKNQDTDDLIFNPRDSEKKDYVGYDVTNTSLSLEKRVTVKVDPCPPASCIFHK
jgi:hypothetical protein